MKYFDLALDFESEWTTYTTTNDAGGTPIWVYPSSLVLWPYSLD